MQRHTFVAASLCALAAASWPSRASAFHAPTRLPQDAAAAAPIESLSNAELLQRARAIGGVASVLPVGVSRSGAEIVAIRLVGSPDRVSKQPALLVVANVDGSQVWSSAMALHHAEELARRANDADVRALLDSTTLYIVPCGNPDANDRRFATPRTEREATGVGVDDDRDGVQGEDPSSDVDGDGRVTLLRVLDPRGEWIADPLDARALVKADRNKGEIGLWRVWPEGRDLDRDELVAEDEPLDACVNRNFPAEWKEHGAASGAFPTDEPETRALCDFVLLHPEIALVVTYGAYDNLVEKPKSVAADALQKRVPVAGVVEADAAVLAELGKRFGELTGSKHKGRGGDAGSLQTWAYAHRGLWSLAITPWDIPLDTPEAKPESQGEEAVDSETKPEAKSEAKSDTKADKKDKREPSDDAKRLRWIDQNPDEAWRFTAWRPFDHPELGACEIGGFTPFARNEPPAAASAEIARKQLDFLVSLGADLPRVRVSELTAKLLDAEVFEVRAAVTNTSRLPLMSASATRTGAVRPARLDLVLAKDAQLLGGERVQLIRSLDGSGGRFEARWLVRAKRADSISVKVTTQHAGGDERVAEVKQ